MYESGKREKDKMGRTITLREAVKTLGVSHDTVQRPAEYGKLGAINLIEWK